jgi:hypothetical protein
MQNRGGGLHKNPAYIYGLSWVGAFDPTLIHQENPKLEHNEEDDAIYTSIPPL